MDPPADGTGSGSQPPGVSGSSSAGTADHQPLHGNPSATNLVEKYISIAPLVQQYLVRYLRSRMQDGVEEIFSLPLRKGCLKALQAALMPAGKSHIFSNFDPTALFLPPIDLLRSKGLDQDDAGPTSVKGKFLQSVVFFKLVRLNPRKCVRQVVKGEQGFKLNDLVVWAVAN